jgi:hypothetical protein
LGIDLELTIEPAFNDDGALSADHDYGPIEAWELLAGDYNPPDRFPHRSDLPVMIRTRTCGGPTDDEDRPTMEIDERRRSIAEARAETAQTPGKAPAEAEEAQAETAKASGETPEETA